MTTTDLFHDGNRSLQDRFGSRRIADRLEELARTEFAPSDQSFIEESIYFFLGDCGRRGPARCLVQGRTGGIRAGDRAQ